MASDLFAYSGMGGETHLLSNMMKHSDNNRCLDMNKNRNTSLSEKVFE